MLQYCGCLRTHTAFASLQLSSSAIVSHFLLSLSYPHFFCLVCCCCCCFCSPPPPPPSLILSELLSLSSWIKEFFHNLVRSAIGLLLVFTGSPGFLYFRPFQKYGTNSVLLITHGASSLSNLCTFFLQKTFLFIFFS